jgi:hypothetical protein
MGDLTDAIAREVTWLNGDSTVTGLLGSVQDYARRKQGAAPRKASLQHSGYVERPWSTGRLLAIYTFRLTVRWPLSTASATVQGTVDDAVNALCARIRGPLLDKSHGGAFLTVVEGEFMAGTIRTVWADAEVAIERNEPLRVDLYYDAADLITA